MSDVDRIYQKYISVFYEVDGGGTWIDLSAVRYALRAALREMADAGCQADRLIDMRSYNVQAKQIERLNDWLLDHAGDLAHDPRIDTADSMIAAADRLRGTVARQTIELAAAVEERNAADQACGKMEAELGILRLRNSELHEYARINQKLNIEIDGLREQLAQMDADNGKLTQQLHAAHNGDLVFFEGKTRTVAEMLAVVDATNGHPTPDEISVVIVPAQTAEGKVSVWAQPGMLDFLSSEVRDYWHGIDAGRWTWRKLPKAVRLEMVRHVLSFGPDPGDMTQAEFDAMKPSWMPPGSAHPGAFGVSWAQMNDARIEVTA